MGSDALLVARADHAPSWSRRDGDREVAFARPGIPAAWLALFDQGAVAMAGSKPKFVALVTEREAGLARLRARRATLLDVFSRAFEPQLARFEQAIESAPEPYLQVVLSGTYVDWTKARMVKEAKALIRTTEQQDDDAWRNLFGAFEGEGAFEHPGYLVCALRGWVNDEPDPQRASYPADAVEATKRLRQRLYPRRDRSELRAELERAADAMRVGVVRAAAFRYELRSDEEEDLRLLARATREPPPAPAEAPAPDPLVDGDRAALHRKPLDRDAEIRLLSNPAVYEPNYFLEDLAPVLFRALRGALVAGTPALPSPRYANELLELVAMLGGDGETGVLAMISGRELDETGALGRALAWLHAYAVWAVATLEHGTGPWTGIASAAPLLVLARFRLRLRASWDASLDLEAPRRRFPAWTEHSIERLAETSRRADALASFVAASEARAPASAPDLDLVPGTLVLQKKRGVTVALAVQKPNVTVASFAHPEKPYPRIAASFVTPLRPPTQVGRVFLGVPRDLPA